MGAKALAGSALPQALIQSTRSVGIRVDAINSLEAVRSNLNAALAENRSFLMTFANPATVILAAHNYEFRDILNEFDIVAPDGVGMVLAMRRLHQKPALRISFDSTSLAPLVFQLAVDKGINVILSGGAPGIAEAAKHRLMLAYPGLQIGVTFSGYGNLDATADAIAALAPGIVIAGMGAPVQESFLLQLVRRGWVGLGFTCGGYLDQLSLKGTKYYPGWVDRCEVRWAYRLFMEPGRLWRRYLLEYPQFGVRLAAALLRAKLQAAVMIGSRLRE
jgi:N-acetylglucosaminyldiphosphoundecaprenol N-acetyl-beta-D-mannosaminyltransferase